MDIELYEVVTIVDSYDGHRNVEFCWFACRHPGFFRWPYADLIKGYEEINDTFRRYATDAIDELFSRDEAEALKAYIDEHHGDYGTTTINKSELPIEPNTMGVGAKAVGGGTDFYTLDREPGYSLSFKAWAYFDLRDREPIDKSVPARHQFPSILIKDGKVITDHAELLDLWRAGEIVASDEIPFVDERNW